MDLGGIKLKKVGLFIVFIILTIFIYFFIDQGDKRILEEEKNAEKVVDDFVLHIKVERAENGIEVHQSLQYIGENKVEIFHQTPLISVSIGNKSHDYTGSLVHKQMREGSIYHQETVKVPVEEKGVNQLYLEAKFLVGEKLVTIEHMEPLMFN